MSRAEFMMVRRDGQPATPFYGEASSMDIRLPAGRRYLIGMDQSSKSTGIYVTDQDISFHFIGTIERNATNKYKFYDDLKFFVRRLIHERDIDAFVTERLLPANRGYSLPTLAELKGYINGWKVDIPELAMMSAERFSEMHPSTWKSVMMDKSKGKGRSNKKREIALDICDKFPELREYLNIVRPSSDHDGFDACGIIHGFRATRNLDGNDPDAVEKIAGIKDYTGDIMVYYRSLSFADATNPDILLEGFEYQAETYGRRFLSTDADENWYSNVKKAASTRAFTMTAVESPIHRAMLRWLFNMGEGDTPWIAYIVRKNVMLASQREMLAKYYHNEQITF